MAVKAILKSECPSGHIYLVPGFLGIKKNGRYYTPPTDEIFVDIMPTGAESVRFTSPTVKLRLLSPAGCVFEKPNKAEPNVNYSYPDKNDKTRIHAVLATTEEQTLNRVNSLSFLFPITGRADRDVTLEIEMTAIPVEVVADSCRWTVSGLGTDTTNIGNLPLSEVS